jgi:hypothetical protein
MKADVHESASAFIVSVRRRAPFSLTSGNSAVRTAVRSERGINGTGGAIRAHPFFGLVSDDGAPARPLFTLHDADDVARVIDVLERWLALRKGRHAWSMGKEMRSRRVVGEIRLTATPFMLFSAKPVLRTEPLGSSP